MERIPKTNTIIVNAVFDIVDAIEMLKNTKATPIARKMTPITKELNLKATAPAMPKKIKAITINVKEKALLVLFKVIIKLKIAKAIPKINRINPVISRVSNFL